MLLAQNLSFAYNASDITILKYYDHADSLISKYLKQDISATEKSILKGLRWLIKFIDKDSNFEFLHTNLFLLLHELSLNKGRFYQQEVAQVILEASLARAEPILAKLYPQSYGSAWKFIGLLHILEHNKKFKNSYYKFFKNNFKNNYKNNFNDDKNYYSQALKNKSYKEIYDYLISTSFLYYYLTQTNTKLPNLPHDNFKAALKQLEELNYDTELSSDSEEFINLGYLATHVILVLTNYGALPIKDSINMRKAAHYIQESFSKVYNLGYIDLLAEYIQCLKIIQPLIKNSTKEISKYEQFLLDQQRSDGSWGNDRSDNGDPYTVFHPTWAVLTAINQ
jgi:hypothetical protein